MDSSLIIALVVIVGIFSICGLAYYKDGIDSFIKVWSIMGVAFGAIISFYFTNHVNQQQITEVKEKNANLVAAAYSHGIDISPDLIDSNRDGYAPTSLAASEAPTAAAANDLTAVSAPVATAEAPVDAFEPVASTENNGTKNDINSDKKPKK
jgi:hypothetical protein